MTRYGTTDTVDGWTKPDTPTSDENAWKQIWRAAAQSKNVDVPRVAAEFYLLEIISAHVGVATPGVTPASELPITAEEFFELLNVKDPDQRARLLQGRVDRLGDEGPIEALTDIRRCAIVAMTELVDTFMPTFYEYLNLAIGGEMRHHIAGGQVLSSNRPIAWSDWRHIFEEHGSDAILNAATLFREFPADAGFGGEPWAQAAEILAAFLNGRLGPDEATNRRLFMDRVWTLEHNNGCILNKVEWVGLENIQKVLNAHAANPPDLRALYRRAGEGVQSLWVQYLNACNVLRDIEGEEPIEHDLSALVYYGRCNHCMSNVEVGHQLACMVYNDENFNGGKFDPNVFTTWYTRYDDEQVDEGLGGVFDFTAEMLAITPQGTMSFDSNQAVRYKVTCVPYTDNHINLGTFDTGYILSTWNEMLAVDIHPKDLMSNEASKETNNMEFRLSAYTLNDDGTDKLRIARFYQWHPDTPFDPTTVINLKDWIQFCGCGLTVEAS